MSKKNRALSGQALPFLALILLAALAHGRPVQAQVDRTPLTIYTAMTATTAQIPLLGALERGWPAGGEARVEYWKNLDDLRALVLAGKGDVWVGHLETLARAAARGAPVSLVAVTVFRKFYFVSAPLPLGQDGAEDWPGDVAALLEYSARHGERITASPQNSPQAALLERLKDPGAPFPTEALPPQQLILDLARGHRLVGLLPEPLATMAVMKNPRLRIIGSLEEEWSRRFGGPGLLPQAGVAVNSALARDRPELTKSLLGLMEETVRDLSGKPPSDRAALLPPEVHEALGPGVLEASLALEPLMIESAFGAKMEILGFLSLAAPDLAGDGALPPGFVWSPR